MVHVTGRGKFEGGYLDGLRGSGGKRPDRFPNSASLEKVTYKRIRGIRSSRGSSGPGFRTCCCVWCRRRCRMQKNPTAARTQVKVPIGVEGGRGGRV